MGSNLRPALALVGGRTLCEQFEQRLANHNSERLTGVPQKKFFGLNSIQKSGAVHGTQTLEKESFSPCGFPVQNGPMTDLLEEAVATARGLPPEKQDEMARVILALAGDERPAYQLTPAEEAEEAEADAAEARGDFATDKEVRAIWAKYGL